MAFLSAVGDKHTYPRIDVVGKYSEKEKGVEGCNGRGKAPVLNWTIGRIGKDSSVGPVSSYCEV